MSSVGSGAKSGVSQQEVLLFVRQMRALLNNMRVYPRGHRLIGEATVRLWNLMQAIVERSGVLVVDCREHVLQLNGESLFKASRERDDSAMIASWLRTRGLMTMEFDGRGRSEELLSVVTWLQGIEASEARAVLEAGGPAHFDLFGLSLNPGASSDRGDPSPQPTPAEGSDPPWEAEQSGSESMPEPSGEVEGGAESSPAPPWESEDAAPGGGRAADLVEHPETPAEQREEDWLDSYHGLDDHRDLAAARSSDADDGGSPAAPSFEAVADDEDRRPTDSSLELIDEPETVDDLPSVQRQRALQASAAGLSTEVGGVDWAAIPPATLDQKLEEAASILLAGSSADGDAVEPLLHGVRSVLWEGPHEALASYLATPLPEAEIGQRLRVSLLRALEDNPRLPPVLTSIASRLSTLDDVGRAIGCLHAAEELVPAAINTGALHAAASALGGVVLATLPVHEPAVVARASTTLQYLGSPELVSSVLNQLDTSTPGNPTVVRSILRVLGRGAVPTLLKVLQDSEDQDVRMAVVESLTDVGQTAKVEGRDVEDLFAPLVQTLKAPDNAPWYLIRNVVSVLSHVEDENFQRLLVQTLDGGLDTRIITEVARGLMRSDSKAARGLLRKAVFQGNLTDPPGVYEVVRHLSGVEPAMTLNDIDEHMLKRSVGAERLLAALFGVAGAKDPSVVAFLKGLLIDRGGVLRRPSHPEPVRIAALEALATIDHAVARAALDDGRDDPSRAVARRADDLLEGSPSRAARDLSHRLGLN